MSVLARPRLCVVVAFRDARKHLPACLRSLAEQSVRDLDVVLVDAGSSDDGARVAKELAGTDPRFRLLPAPVDGTGVGGIGAARNAGVAAAIPGVRYLAILDGTEAVTPDAYRLLLDSLDATGSDLATGQVELLDAAGRRHPDPRTAAALATSAPRAHIDTHQDLVHDTAIGNKVFRRSYWDSRHLAFPEGRGLRDLEVTLPAHHQATAVDVVGAPVLLRRTDAATALATPADVLSLAAGYSAVNSFLAARPGPRLAAQRATFAAAVLRDELGPLLRALPNGSAEYRAAFLDLANRVLDAVDPQALDRLPSAQRMQWLLVRKRALDELLVVLGEERRGRPLPVRGRFGHKYPSLGELPEGVGGIPRNALRVEKDLVSRAPLHEVRWVDGRLRLAGDAWIERIDLPTRRSVLKMLQLKEHGSKRRQVVPVRNVYSPGCTADHSKGRFSYDWAGWEYELDPERLKRRGRWREGTWYVGIAVAAGSLVRRRSLSASGGDAAAHPPYHWVSEDFRIVPSYQRTSLRLRVERVRALVTGHRQDGDALVVEGEIRSRLATGDRLALRLRRRSDGETSDLPGEVLDVSGNRSRFAVRVPLTEVAVLPGEDETDEAARDSALTASDPDRRSWSTSLVVTAADGAERRYSTVVREGLPDGRFPLAGTGLPDTLGARAAEHEVAALAGTAGYLSLTCRPLRALLDGAHWTDDGRLVLTGAAPVSAAPVSAAPAPAAEGPVLVVKAHDRAEERLAEARWLPDGSFRAELTPAAISGPDRDLPLATGRWNLALRCAGRTFDLTTDRLAAPRFPLPAEAAGRRYRLEVRWQDAPQLVCLPELADTERGAYHRERLRREVYQPARSRPLRDTVLYFSYNGRQYSDSPRAVHEELVRRGAPLEHLWVLADAQAALPRSVRRVVMYSAEWYEALATSRYVVTNAQLPEWVERRDAQVIVQTWHGTMLKKIGIDAEHLKDDVEFRERMIRTANSWSLAVSANRFSTPILRRAFGYQGEILEAGYPRNDVLYAPDRDKTAARLRAELGIPAGKKVVLYAPTWRDDDTYGGYRCRFDLRLDLDDARRRLGADHVLLIRKHSTIVDQVPGTGDGFVFDVSDHPDIADLYLLADVLVTDYSSVMFDYAHLRRPMLFFTYDLEHYRDTLRGFYFDFEANAPGPLVRTSAELVDALLDLDAVTSRHHDAYQRFLELFCDLDDGHAAQRVVDRMLEQGRQGGPVWSSRPGTPDRT